MRCLCPLRYPPTFPHESSWSSKLKPILSAFSASFSDAFAASTPSGSATPRPLTPTFVMPIRFARKQAPSPRARCAPFPPRWHAYARTQRHVLVRRRRQDYQRSQERAARVLPLSSGAPARPGMTQTRGAVASAHCRAWLGTGV